MSTQFMSDNLKRREHLGDLSIDQRSALTLSLLMSYVYMEFLVKPEILMSYIYGPTFGNSESRVFLFAAQCSNIESM
jgi:hypothetical protein